MWLKLAFEKQAKEINISDVCFDFPNFTSQSLVTLELRYCEIFLQFPVNLGSLKKLILFHTYMREEAFQQLICGCPSLQELHIEQLPTTNKLRLTAPNIHKLSLVFMEENHFDDQIWSLDVPNLKSLDLEIGWIPNVIDVSSIQDVYLKGLYVYEKQLGRFDIFLEKFSGIEVFQLSLNASEPFFHSVDDLHLLQIRWKRVVLGLKILCQECLLGVYLLMRSSKNLEELDIYIGTTLRAIPDLPPVELYPCVMPKLKTVTLHGYAKPWKHQLQLIEFLLKSATVLEKLVIVSNKPHELNFVMRVSSFQRSSPSARVLFL